MNFIDFVKHAWLSVLVVIVMLLCARCFLSEMVFYDYFSTKWFLLTMTSGAFGIWVAAEDLKRINPEIKTLKDAILFAFRRKD